VTGKIVPLVITLCGIASLLQAQLPRMHYPVNLAASMQRVYAPVAPINRHLHADLAHKTPPEPWNRQDSATAIYKRAITLMEDERYREAASEFVKIPRRYPSSSYAADAYYWAAFAWYRVGTAESLRTAVIYLNEQRQQYPRAITASDGRVLATRIIGEIAKLTQDPESIRALIEVLHDTRECSRTGTNMKVAALSALRTLNPPMAMYYLKDIFAGRQDCAESLRKQSVFILSQIESAEASDLLFNLAERGRETDVRVEAVNWLSDSYDVRAIRLFESLLRGPSPYVLREAALIALMRQATNADAQIFRDVASSSHIPSRIRVQALGWLADQRINDQSDWIIRMYSRERNDDVRLAVVSAVAAQNNVSDREWLFAVARDTSATVAVRARAVAAAGSLGIPSAKLYELYATERAVPVREQIIEQLAQHSESSAVERLIDITTSESEAALRRIALRMLRESKDPRAVAFVASYREKD
jgi:HEAT repeat protein